jgi:tetratricopeptide (TPR) repeat protein
MGVRTACTQTCVNEDAELGRSDVDFSWLAYQETARKWFEVGRQRAACNEWRAGFEIAEQLGANDPRRAASLSNLAIALCIEGDYPESERLYRAAEQAWKDAAPWVEQMQFQPRARSSLFHLRLEARHARTYKQSVIAGYQRLLCAGRAVTLSNLGELFELLARAPQARDLYAQAHDLRATSMDEAETLAQRMSAKLRALSGESPAGTPPLVRSSAFAYTALSFSAQAERMRWIVDQPAEFTDEGRLMAAVLCAQMLS